MDEVRDFWKTKNISLAQATANGGIVEALSDGWRLTIPAGTARSYRLAQLDDTRHLQRKAFHWQAPLRFSLRARVSANDLPGTWGFGLWNDPFAAGLGLGGGIRKLPALPQTAWFFHASPKNWLSLQDDPPANGFLAAAFSSRRISQPLLGLGAPALPLLFIHPAARILRRMARRFIHDVSFNLEIDPTAWHSYQLDLRGGGVRYSLDGHDIFQTALAPAGPLGLVIWIDNQYAAFPPNGRLGYGLEVNPQPAWLEVGDLLVESSP